jgi:PAS domain-containing protein
MPSPRPAAASRADVPSETNVTRECINVGLDTIDMEVLLWDAHQDIVETLRALRVSEAKSRNQAEQLRALSDELSTTLNTAGIGIARCSRDLRYLRANETYSTIVGLPVDAIIGRPIVEVVGETAFATIRPYILNECSRASSASRTSAFLLEVMSATRAIQPMTQGALPSACALPGCWLLPRSCPLWHQRRPMQNQASLA